MSKPKAPYRIRDIDSGRVMVVTDLHGDWQQYQRYRDYFLGLWSGDHNCTLVIAGDYIHSEGPPEEDRSLDIVLDLMQLKASIGRNLVVLLGNHEFPHIYHIPLVRGSHLYTPRFEAVLGEYRQAVMQFFKSLPFWVRTKAGVSMCHAGAFEAVHDTFTMERLFSFSHEDLLVYGESILSDSVRQILYSRVSADIGIPYPELVRLYLAVMDATDPRYDDFLIGTLVGQHADFNLLWSILFSANEYEYGKKAYSQHVWGLLNILSSGYERQRVLICGHMGCRGGFEILAKNQQLRLASGVHAYPREEARALLFDAERPVKNARDLISGLLHFA